MKQHVTKIIYDESKASGCPIFVITDDTICSKTIPSSKAKHPIEAAGFHFSHLKRKQDYGHQAVAVLLSCNGITLPYDTILYDKSVSKIDIVKQIAEELPLLRYLHTFFVTVGMFVKSLWIRLSARDFILSVR